jgi:micrococcal nuclease
MRKIIFVCLICLSVTLCISIFVKGSAPDSSAGVPWEPLSEIVDDENDDILEEDKASFAETEDNIDDDEIDAPADVAVETNATVTHVVDGDTLDVWMDGGEEARVRLLGVNTPEVVDPRKPVECFGKEASAFTKSTLNGKRVRLEADPKADERDKYGRLLRNVILENGTDFNAELVASGYAYAYTFFPLDPLRKREIIRLQNGAKSAGRGLWAEGACGE